MGTQQYVQTVFGVGDELANYVNATGSPLCCLGPVSRVNVLVGPTNSGKSRLLRGLLKSPSYSLFETACQVEGLANVLLACRRLSQANLDATVTLGDSQALNRDPYETPWLPAGTDRKPLVGKRGEESLWNPQRFGQIEKALETAVTSSNADEAGKASQQLDVLLRWLRPLAWHFIPGVPFAGKVHFPAQPTPSAVDDLKLMVQTLGALLTQPRPRVVKPKRVYIPVLRSAVNLGAGVESSAYDPLSESVASHYGLGRSEDLDVFTGNMLYREVRENRNAPRELRTRQREFERFLSQTFFSGADVEMIPIDSAHGRGENLELCIGDTQRPIHDIGDGIQSIVILMYRLFMADEGSWVFIEEPEQGLHPGLQRIFVETLLEHPALRERALTVFMSTHSNHLLGIAVSEYDEATVLSLQKLPDQGSDETFRVWPVYSREQGLLASLGVANSSVFLANCGVWVEGITDRKYLRAYMRAYLHSQEFLDGDLPVMQEDIHYGFFEYAGSNLVHYLFGVDSCEPEETEDRIRAQFISNRIVLLADRDKAKNEKHAELHKMASGSGYFHYLVTPGVEVENLVSAAQLRRVLPELMPDIAPDDVSKIDVREDDYRKVHIGRYLREHFPGRCPKALAAENGALKTYYKNRLADLVAADVAWDTMSEDAKELTRQVYRFILCFNS